MGYIHGTRWTEEKIKDEILKVIKALNLDRMPSNQEIRNSVGNTKLTNAIRRNGGFYYWANKLKLEIKNCETKLGKDYENIVKEVLEEKGYKGEQMSVKHPYDLLVNGYIKVDVKAARRYYYTNNNYFYTFNLEKSKVTCDIYICITINEEQVERIFIIPSKFLNKTQLSIGATSYYDRYINRWDYLDKFNEFYRKLI